MWCEREWDLYTPVLALRVALQLALDHVDHNLVANQATLIHDLLGLPSEVGLLRDLGPQHVTSSLGKKEKKLAARVRHKNSDCGWLTRWQTQNFSLMFGAWVPLPSLRVRSRF